MSYKQMDNNFSFTDLGTAATVPYVYRFCWERCVSAL